MKNKILKFLFYKYQSYFSTLFVQDFFGFIPSDINEPSIEFLSANKVVLEKFFSIQAYNIKNRSIQDNKNAEFYTGMLVHIRSLLLAIQKVRTPKVSAEIPEKKEDPMDRVSTFVKAAKEYLKPIE